jgi:hypothetical protein
MTSESEYSKYSVGVGTSPAQRVPGAFSSLNHSNPGSSPQSHQQRHYDENPDALTTSTLLEPGKAKAVPNPTSEIEADGDDTPSDIGDDASQDRDSPEGKHESSFIPPRRGLAKPQAQHDSWVESSSLGPVDTATTSVSETGTPSAPPSWSYVER